MRLQDKIALVTGSGRGIGRAIAVRFAREGADVVINYGHHDDEAEQTLAEVEAAGRRGHIVKADLGVVADVARLVAEGISQFGRLDILINNAGVEVDAPFLLRRRRPDLELLGMKRGEPQMTQINPY